MVVREEDGRFVSQRKAGSPPQQPTLVHACMMHACKQEAEQLLRKMNRLPLIAGPCCTFNVQLHLADI